MKSLAIALLTELLAWQSASAEYPTRPIRIIVAIGAGRTADATARTLAHPLSRALGQPVVVENKPDADGAIAAEIVRHSVPDGYTLLLGAQLPSCDAISYFTPLSFVGRFTICLFAHPDVPAETLVDARSLLLLEKFRGPDGRVAIAHHGPRDVPDGRSVGMAQVGYRGASDERCRFALTPGRELAPAAGPVVGDDLP